MELLIESFPSEVAMTRRKTELEANGRSVVYQGPAGPATDVLIRVWDDSDKAKSQVVDLVNKFVLVCKP